MTKRLNDSYLSIADIMALNGRFILANQGIDTIKLVAKYEVFKKMAEKMGLTLEPLAENNKLWKKVDDEVKSDTKRRLKAENFKPSIEVIKLPKVNPKDKDLYISITRNTPLLFDVATKRKTSKDTFCLITFAGLHQPTKRINSEAVKIISKFLKRKAFKTQRIEIATDTKERTPINKEGTKVFKERLAPYSKRGVTLEKSSYYINNPTVSKGSKISKIIFYDKYNKQRNQQKEIITNDLKTWRRLEITLTFDVTKRSNKGFIAYMESMGFLDDLYEVHTINQQANIKNYADDYLIMQLNSFLDNRFLNNRESKEQFNSVNALERFKSSDFRRYILAF